MDVALEVETIVFKVHVTDGAQCPQFALHFGAEKLKPDTRVTEFASSKKFKDLMLRWMNHSATKLWSNSISRAALSRTMILIFHEFNALDSSSFFGLRWS